AVQARGTVFKDPVMNPPSGYAITLGTRASSVGLLAAGIGCAVLFTMPFWAGSSTMRLLIEIMCFLALAQMWNLLAGYGGLISIGQQAFVGIGAYGLFLCANHLGVNPFIAVLLGG